MSPQAGVVLIEEIAPRLRAAIPQCVKTVGCEDHEELYQDGLAMAAHLMEGLEKRGKEVTPGNVAYYTILHLKSGRRSYSTGHTDVMGSATQIGHNSMVLSFEEEVGHDDELNEPIRLEEMLADHHDDPSMAAGRNLDWEEFISTHDCRYICIIHDLASGFSMLDTSRACRMPYHEIRELRERLVDDLEEFMGDDAIADSAAVPGWRGTRAKSPLCPLRISQLSSATKTRKEPGKLSIALLFPLRGRHHQAPKHLRGKRRRERIADLHSRPTTQMHHQHSRLGCFRAVAFSHRLKPLKTPGFRHCQPLAGGRFPSLLQPPAQRLVVDPRKSRKTLPGHSALIELRQQHLPPLSADPHPPPRVHRQYLTGPYRTCRICHTEPSMTLLLFSTSGARNYAYDHWAN